MSEISTMLPEGFFAEMNTEQTTVKVDQDDIPPGDDPDTGRADLEDQYQSIEDEAAEDPGESIFNQAQGSGDILGGMDAEKAANLATFFADLCTVGKELIGDKYAESFLSACDREFGEEKRLELFVLAYADKADGVSLESIGTCLVDCQKRSPKFQNLDFVEVAQTGIQYKRLKEKYSTREIQAYQREGIERYTREYLGSLSDFEPSPLVLLLMILAITFGADLFRLGKNELADRKAKKDQRRKRE